MEAFASCSFGSKRRQDLLIKSVKAIMNLGRLFEQFLEKMEQIEIINPDISNESARIFFQTFFVEQTFRNFQRSNLEKEQVICGRKIYNRIQVL